MNAGVHTAVSGEKSNHIFLNHTSCARISTSYEVTYKLSTSGNLHPEHMQVNALVYPAVSGEKSYNSF